MSSISAVSGSNSYYAPLSSGKQINSAADDAAGMAIVEGMKNQSAGQSAASNNAKDMSNLLNVSDGALGQIGDSLSRIRELATQASNGIYTDSDRGIFQKEINGLLENINDISKNTNYNGKPLLDGSFSNQNAAVGPNGQSTDISIKSSLTDDLGLSGFDVTSGNVDLSGLDKAIEQVSSQRADGGAMTNRLGYTQNALDNAQIQTEAARSRKEDTDMAKAMLEKSSKDTRDQVEIHMQKMTMQGMGNYLSLMGA